MTTKAAILKTIRAKCLDCSCHQPQEVRLCPVQTCDLFPFRFGRDPNPSRRGFGAKPFVYTSDLQEDKGACNLTFDEKASARAQTRNRGESKTPSIIKQKR